MKWHELKWPTVQSMDKQIPVLIPLGSVEQHGYHLPLVTDTAQVVAIAEGVEARLGDCVLLLPTLWLGSSHHHLAFPGTLSVRPSLYSQVLQELTISILRAGFRRIFFLNGHGGNEIPASQALGELVATDDLAQHALLAMANWWSVGKPDQKRLQLESPSITHACEFETSLMLHLQPSLVDVSQAVDVAPAIDSTWLTGDKRIALFRRFASMTPSGNLGKPTAATPGKGEAILRDVIDDVVRFLEEFSRWALPATVGPPTR